MLGLSLSRPIESLQNILSQMRWCQLSEHSGHARDSRCIADELETFEGDLLSSCKGGCHLVYYDQHTPLPSVPTVEELSTVNLCM
jgi:hypothetical protein